MAGLSAWYIALVVSLLGGLMLPPMVGAQAGFYVTPSFSFSEVYDDNLLSTPSHAQGERQEDFISRFSPGIQAGYRSTPLTLLGSYSFDAEVFAEHTEHTAAQARQRASLDWTYLPSRLLTLSLTGSYLRTQTPRDINVTTGVDLGRALAQTYTAQPSIVYRLDPLTTGTTSYAFSQIEVSGGVTSRTHSINLGLDRQVTPGDSVNLGYIFRRFDFDVGETTTSHAFTLGWTHKLAQLTSLTLRAGPRFSQGSIEAEISASLSQQLQHGQLSLTYTRSNGAVTGVPGAVNVDSVTATLAYQPWRFLKVSATPQFSRSTGNNFDTKVYQASLNGTYQVNQWVSVQASYQFSLQQGSTVSLASPVGSGNGDIYHNIFFVTLAITRPYRVY